MRIFGIAGFKNAGKTTLVVDLVREMTRRGLRVATVKHAHHEFDIDHPGKDSFLHRQAGAAEVIVSSARRWAHISELNESPEPALEELLAHLGDVDLVLIEGYKHGGHPRLEVRRSGQADGLLAAEHSEIAAIVCDDDVPESPVPVLKRSNINVIVDFVLAEVGLSTGTGD